jgi:hypothetical protein
MKKTFIFLFLISTLFLAPSQAKEVRAANTDSYIVLAPLPGTTDCENRAVKSGESCRTDLPTYLTGIFKLFIALAAIIAILTIIWAGIKYMSAEKIGSKKEAIESIQNALWGLLLIILSFIILNTINPKILNFNLSISQIDETPPEPDAPDLSGFGLAIEKALKDLNQANLEAKEMEKKANLIKDPAKKEQALKEATDFRHEASVKGWVDSGKITAMASLQNKEGVNADKEIAAAVSAATREAQKFRDAGQTERAARIEAYANTALSEYRAAKEQTTAKSNNMRNLRLGY